jgi:hypothetical protein
MEVVMAAMSRHTIFVGQSTMFGREPSETMKVGDFLYVLFGADVPFLLRSHRDGYLVVGKRYAHDMMHGEVLDRLSANPEGPLKEAWLKLV